MGRVQDSTAEALKVPAEQRNCQGDPEMAAQEEKSRKNAKERRKKKKAAGGSKESVAVRSDKGGATAPTPKGSLPERIVRYWRGVIAETRRVSWPSKPELIAGTVASIVILMVFAGWLGGLDLLLRKLLG